MAISDAAYARRQLEDAVGMNTNPTLSIAQVDDLMVRAASIDPDTLATIYVEADLNAAAAMGWAKKAALTSDRYDIGGGPGQVLNESQWRDYCRQMSADYQYGRLSVLGGSGRRGGGIGTITLTTYPDTGV